MLKKFESLYSLGYGTRHIAAGVFHVSFICKMLGYQTSTNNFAGCIAEKEFSFKKTSKIKLTALGRMPTFSINN